MILWCHYKKVPFRILGQDGYYGILAYPKKLW